MVQLATPPFAGELAMVGTTIDADWLEDVWLVRGDPCGILVQSRIGDSNGVAYEAGFDLREVFVPIPPMVATGDLALVGYTGVDPSIVDATLLFANVGSLLPIFGNRFGGSADEIFYSLAENPAGSPQQGFILAGLTRAIGKARATRRISTWCGRTRGPLAVQIRAGAGRRNAAVAVDRPQPAAAPSGPRFRLFGIRLAAVGSLSRSGP